jgi:hypothetical protein
VNRLLREAAARAAGELVVTRQCWEPTNQDVERFCRAMAWNEGPSTARATANVLIRLRKAGMRWTWEDRP